MYNRKLQPLTKPDPFVIPNQTISINFEDKNDPVHHLDNWTLIVDQPLKDDEFIDV